MPAAEKCGRLRKGMSDRVGEIEVEVLEIDGVKPAEPTGEQPAGKHGKVPAWMDLRGRVGKLDRRWWPLWVALGL